MATSTVNMSVESSNSVASYIGSRVSIEMCGGMGYFQGTVLAIDDSKQHIKLEDIIHDGRPTSVKEMMFSAEDIKILEVLSGPAGPADAPSPMARLRSQLQQVEVASAAGPPPSNKELQQTSDAITDFLRRSKADSAAIMEPVKSPLSLTKSLSLDVSTNKHSNGSAAQAATVNKALTKHAEREPATTGSGASKAQQSLTIVDSAVRPTTSPVRSVPRAPLTKSLSAQASRSPYHSGLDQVFARSRKGEQQWHKNNNTFGSDIYETDISQDFDFESNNKLFDKRAVAKEIDQMLLDQQPDVVSQTEQRNHGRTRASQQPPSTHKRQQATPQQQYHEAEYQLEAKFRFDENVLPCGKAVDQLISLPTDEVTEVIYATDCGFLVPGLSNRLRSCVLSTATQFGFTITRQHEVTGRAAAELCMQLLGGEHRLSSNNSHQLPRIVVLCGSHQQGALGLNTARQLLTHDLLTTVITPSTTSPPLPYTHELKLYELSEGEVLHSVASLDRNATIDLILDARLDHKGTPAGDGGHEWLSEVSTWAQKQRCPVLALDPPSHDHVQHSKHLLPARALIVPALPLVYTEQQGRVHLVKLALPSRVYKDLGITFRSPFQAKFMVTLHPCD